ncbi:MAG: DUF1223 domain-containing protein [Alphaproteobacteria bacterium]
MSIVKTITALSLSCVFAAGLVVFAAADATAGKPKLNVIELFTSQGCSSCPPADAYLGDLTKRSDILALSFAVDYWDFLGWKDTFGSPANSERQRVYARARGDGQVYTPQIVINGQRHEVGSHRPNVEAAIKATSAARSARDVAVSIKIKGDAVNIKVGDGENRVADDATIWLVLYQKKASVKIGRGENGGRTVVYHNIVRKMTPIGMWSGGSEAFSLPRKELTMPGYDGCAVLVQAKNSGPILGAAALDGTAFIN